MIMSSDSDSDSEHSNSFEKNQHEITLDEEFSKFWHFASKMLLRTKLREKVCLNLYI